MDTSAAVKVLVALFEHGIVFPKNRGVEPQKCSYLPRDARDFKGPVGLSYTEIDAAVEAGYVYASLYEGYYSIHWTYKGKLFYYMNTGRKNRQFLREWRELHLRPGKYRICCNKAVPMRCCCFVSTLCPDHKHQCHGTHD